MKQKYKKIVSCAFKKSNQMNIRKYILAITIIMATLYACKKDDDNGGLTVVPPRDAAEQQVTDEETLQDYLKTHFYTEVDVDLNNDGIVEYQTRNFDTIAGVNSGETPILDSDLLEVKTITRDEVEYKLYVLNFRKGKEGELKATFADSTYVTYRGELLYDNKDKDGDGISDEADVDADGDGVLDDKDSDGDGDIDNNDSGTRTDADGDGIADDSDVDFAGNEDEPDSDGDGIIDEKDTVDNTDPNRRVFDSAINPAWFDQVGVIEGWREALIGLSGASNFTMPIEPNDDGTISYNNDFADVTVFMPSGLGYFSRSQNGIPAYSPLIFNIQLYGVNQADHDNDGIPSYLEDLDGDRLVFDEDDDTDGDNIPNYTDQDDDGDRTLTRDEDLEPDTDLNIDRDGDGDATNDIGNGDPTDDDTDGDGIPNYLDPDDKASRNDTN